MLERHLVLGMVRGWFDHLSSVPTYVGFPLPSSEGHDIKTWALSCTCNMK